MFRGSPGGRDVDAEVGEPAHAGSQPVGFDGIDISDPDHLDGPKRDDRAGRCERLDRRETETVYWRRHIDPMIRYPSVEQSLYLTGQ